MSFPGAPVLLALYYSVLVVLAFYGIHRFLLAMLYLKTRRLGPERPPDPEKWPVVTVQLPLYNEMYVAERLIDAVCGLDYPPGCLEIQVLDDSTDETAEIVAAAVARHRAPSSRRGRSRPASPGPGAGSWRSSTPTSCRGRTS
jgi:cellulose synthase/poly-beta-1,6-N-acetylglucosamine synthase-like glycosyltransferase